MAQQFDFPQPKMAELALATVQRLESVEQTPRYHCMVKATVLGHTVMVKYNVPQDTVGVLFKIAALVPKASLPKKMQAEATCVVDSNLYLPTHWKRFRGEDFVTDAMFIPISDYPQLAGLALGTNVTDMLGVLDCPPDPYPSESSEDEEPMSPGVYTKENGVWTKLRGVFQR